MNILETIARTKRVEVEATKRLIPEKTLRVEAHSVLKTVLSISEAIRNSKSGIIAEHKRRSPSRGEIKPMSDVGRIASSYMENGASAMSVLTDTPYFGGSLTDLFVARAAAPRLPLLRKEFIVDPYQIYQARLAGADAILLIASILDRNELKHFTEVAHSLGLETLVEIHSEKEIENVPAEAEMVGVNNRDLTNFRTDVAHSSHLYDLLPSEPVKIAESGIRTPEDMLRLREFGFDGFLIGEAFMSKEDPGKELAGFVKVFDQI